MNKIFIFSLLAGGVLVIIFGVYKVLYLQKAHSTFDNYYAFRGCTQLLEKTPDYGICKTKSDETIKIVKFDNRWFLDGDLPCGFLCF
jgi:hypothetical protein